MTSFVPGWYLIYTKPRHEKKIVTRITERALECYSPTQKKLRNWRGRMQMVDMPLFPCYIFIYLHQLKDYFTALGIEGVLSFVRFGKQIAKVADVIVANLKVMVNEDTEIEVSYDYFQKGDQLLIKEGPLAGHTCEVVTHKGKRKMLVRVELLNGNVIVDLATSQLGVHMYDPYSNSSNSLL